MTLILSGTNGLSDVDGSAATPAIRGTDTNTGIFFPAADIVGIATGGTERARVDSSGNLGIGVTPSAWATFKALQIAGAGFMGTSSDLNASANAYYNAGWKYYGTGLATLYNQSAGVHSWYNAVSGTAGNAISLTQAMTLDSSGNLVVGDTTANRAGASKGISVNGTSSSVLEANYNGGRAGFTYSYASGTIFGEFRNLPILFATNDTERARIDSGGNLLVGTTSNTSSAKFLVNGRVGFEDAAGNKNAVTFIQNKGAGSANSGGFGLAYTTVNYTPGSASSNIYWDGGTGYFTLSTSSRKYKRNITPVTDEQLDKALLLKPSYYQRLEYDYWEYGLIAEEVHDVGLDEFVTRVEGEISGLNYEKMVTLAFGLIQRQQAIITQLQADVAALKGNA